MPINKDELFDIFREYATKEFEDVPSSDDDVDYEFSAEFEKKMSDIVGRISEPQKTISKSKNHHNYLKKILVAVAIAAVLISANFVALACGIDTVSILKDWGNNIVKMVVGEKVEYKGINIIKEKESTYFDSIVEFNEKTDYNILYPSVLPEETELTKIAIVGSYDADYNYVSSYDTILFITNTPEITFVIHTNDDYPKGFITDPDVETKEINGFVCYISRIDEVVQCSFVHNGFTYVVKTLNDEDLTIIIGNLKENR